MARPQIPDVIKTRVEDIHERHRGYPANSFQEALSTVADLAEQELQNVEIDQNLPFQYEVEDFSSGIKMLLTPEPDSEITRTSGGLETPKALVQLDDLYEQFKEIDGVRTAHGTSGEMIEVIIRDDTERSFDKVVDDIFTVLGTAIQRQENKIAQIEERADQYASRKESSEE